MIEIIKIKVNLYIQYGECLSVLAVPGAEWLRAIVSRILGFKDNGLDMSSFDRNIFFNEDIKTHKGKNSYPLILFHHVGNDFYLTGFNNGARMLESLFKSPQKLIYLDKKTVVRFISQPIEQFDIKVSESFHTYRLLNWIPYKMAEFKQKIENCREIKMRLSNLEQRIQLQIMKDIANHFNLQLEIPEIRLFDINTKDGVSVYYEDHEYKSFTPIFETKLYLPENIGLGHGKAFGFGITHVLDKMSTKN